MNRFLAHSVLFLILLATVAAGRPSSAHAEDYAKPDWANLLRTLIRFSALTLDDDVVLDEYAIATECDLYKTFYREDFQWNRVRKTIRESVRQNVATFPTSYSYTTQLQLDRYDFNEKLFRFTQKTTIHNVNALNFYKIEGASCDGVSVKLVPTSFRAVLDVPIFVEGIPIGASDAENLLNHMKAEGNTDRVVNAVFNMRIVYIDPLRPANKNGDGRGLSQGNNPEERSVRLDVRLDSIDFYEDATKTKLIYKLQP